MSALCLVRFADSIVGGSVLVKSKGGVLPCTITSLDL